MDTPKFDLCFMFVFSAHVCQVDQEEYVKQFSSVPTSDPIGFIERDGNLQNYATSEDEKFFLGDSVEQGVTVHIGCSNWYVNT